MKYTWKSAELLIWTRTPETSQEHPEVQRARKNRVYGLGFLGFRVSLLRFLVAATVPNTSIRVFRPVWHLTDVVLCRSQGIAQGIGLSV